MSGSKNPEEEIKKLPTKLNGYTRRVMVLDDFVVIEYSKRALFIRHVHPDVFDSKVVEDNLLFDVVASNMEEAIERMQEKIKEYKSNSI